ncbi:MAG: hypothetical protein V4597_18415 [Pseudomonadota bacterium]
MLLSAAPQFRERLDLGRECACGLVRLIGGELLPLEALHAFSSPGHAHGEVVHGEHLRAEGGLDLVGWSQPIQEGQTSIDPFGEGLS